MPAFEIVNICVYREMFQSRFVTVKAFVTEFTAILVDSLVTEHMAFVTLSCCQYLPTFVTDMSTVRRWRGWKSWPWWRISYCQWVLQPTKLHVTRKEQIKTRMLIIKPLQQTSQSSMSVLCCSNTTWVDKQFNLYNLTSLKFIRATLAWRTVSFTYFSKLWSHWPIKTFYLIPFKPVPALHQWIMH